MAKGDSKSAVAVLTDQEDAGEHRRVVAHARPGAGPVLGLQTKLHRRARVDASRRFDDLFNLVADPAFLTVAWGRVRGNLGARTPGVDGETAYYVETVRGTERFLSELRADVKARTFTPLPVCERLIPKRSGKLRRLMNRPGFCRGSRPWTGE